MGIVILLSRFRPRHRPGSWASPHGGSGPESGRPLAETSVRDLIPLIRPGDTLLSEVSFGTGPPPVPDLHLDATSVAALAARTGVARVLLTHLQMNYDPAATVDAVRGAFDGPVRLVAPGDELEIDVG